jgi:hypothetical protein
MGAQQSFVSQPRPASPGPTATALPPPLKPVFGVSLDDLYNRDQTAVPMIVYQCMQAVDLFGLDVEGIYRVSGTASHVQQIKALFDHGMSIYVHRLKYQLTMLQTRKSSTSETQHLSITM